MDWDSVNHQCRVCYTLAVGVVTDANLALRLVADLFVLVVLACLNFNSIKVRLELRAGSGAAGNFAFQFHKGTIRTVFHLSLDAVDEISIP